MFAMLMGLKSIAPRELHGCMVQGGVTVVDVNARQSWLKARVPGALNLAPDFDAGSCRRTWARRWCSTARIPCAARRRRRRAGRNGSATRTCVSCRPALPAGSAPACRSTADTEGKGRPYPTSTSLIWITGFWLV